MIQSHRLLWYLFTIARYSNGLTESKTKFIDFILKLVSNGISSNIYIERAELIILSLKLNIEELEYNTSLVICDTIPKTIYKIYVMTVSNNHRKEYLLKSKMLKTQRDL